MWMNAGSHPEIFHRCLHDRCHRPRSAPATDNELQNGGALLRDDCDRWRWPTAANEGQDLFITFPEPHVFVIALNNQTRRRSDCPARSGTPIQSTRRRSRSDSTSPRACNSSKTSGVASSASPVRKHVLGQASTESSWYGSADPAHPQNAGSSTIWVAES